MSKESKALIKDFFAENPIEKLSDLLDELYQGAIEAEMVPPSETFMNVRALKAFLARLQKDAA